MVENYFNKQKINLKRGDIFYADLCGVQGSEQGGIRPVLVIQNDKGNQYSPTTIVAAITSQVWKASNLPTHILLKKEESGLLKDSIVLLEQIRTVDKCRLKGVAGHASETQMLEIEGALRISLAMLFMPVAC